MSEKIPTKFHYGGNRKNSKKLENFWFCDKPFNQEEGESNNKVPDHCHKSGKIEEQHLIIEILK